MLVTWEVLKSLASPWKPDECSNKMSLARTALNIIWRHSHAQTTCHSHAQTTWWNSHSKLHFFIPTCYIKERCQWRLVLTTWGRVSVHTKFMWTFLGNRISRFFYVALCTYVSWFYRDRREHEYALLLLNDRLYGTQRYRLFFFFKCSTIIICSLLIKVLYWSVSCSET